MGLKESHPSKIKTLIKSSRNPKNLEIIGYTHYYDIPKELDKDRFQDLIKDCKKIVGFADFELGIDIAGPLGEGKPEYTDDIIAINGSDTQRVGIWTTSEQISIPWPSETAGITEPTADPLGKTEGTWFAGHVLSQRVAPIRENGLGSGSYESFCIPRFGKKYEWSEPNKKGNYFSFCKTAYRPYDLVVTAMLVALKHHFPQCGVSSDGEMKDWMDGMLTCQKLFGYGMDFQLGGDED
jgi:hypothetical protein